MHESIHVCRYTYMNLFGWMDLGRHVYMYGWMDIGRTT